MDWMTASHDHTLTYTASGIGCNDRKKMIWLELKQISNLNSQYIAEASYNILLSVLQVIVDDLILVSTTRAICSVFLTYIWSCSSLNKKSCRQKSELGVRWAKGMTKVSTFRISRVNHTDVFW